MTAVSCSLHRSGDASSYPGAAERGLGDAEVGGAGLDEPCGKKSKTPSFEPFHARNDHFAETGSGRTQGNVEKEEGRFVQLLVSMGMAVFLQASNRCTERGVPAVIRWGYCITSFIACLAWIDLLAEESVALLEVSIRKRSFLTPFDLEMISLPRQARDKHGESSTQ